MFSNGFSAARAFVGALGASSGASTLCSTTASRSRSAGLSMIPGTWRALVFEPNGSVAQRNGTEIEAQSDFGGLFHARSTLSAKGVRRLQQRRQQLAAGAGTGVVGGGAQTFERSAALGRRRRVMSPSWLWGTCSSCGFTMESLGQAPTQPLRQWQWPPSMLGKTSGCSSCSP